MGGIDWWAFVAVAATAYALPGPDFTVVLRSATRSRRAGTAAACGAQLGLCVHVLLAVFGLSVVLAHHPDVLTGLRVLGGVYLLYLGGRLVVPTLRQSERTERSGRPVTAVADAPTRAAFARALLTNLLNPKAVLFFAAVLPQFVVPGGAPVPRQIAALGALDVAVGLLVWPLVVALGVRLSAALRRRRVRQWWDRTTGGVLAGLGGGLLLTRG